MDTKVEGQSVSPNDAKPLVSRRFFVGDWVVYKPFENCSKVDISGKGEVVEVLPDGEYKVTFGHRSMYGTRTGKYHWTKLWLASENGG